MDLTKNNNEEFPKQVGTIIPGNQEKIALILR
jgi:hypothetical protein